MFPDAEDAPALAAELTVDTAVAGDVGLTLLVPKLPVGLRPRIAPRAAVPETAVHKDCDFMFGEGKVGLAEDRPLPSPSGDAFRAQEGCKQHLRLLVALPSDAGHDFGAFRPREDVGHRSAERIGFFNQIGHKTLLACVRRSHNHGTIKPLINCLAGCFGKQDTCMTGGKIGEL